MPNDPFEEFRNEVASRYRIDREIGRGGMAAVYLANDLKHHRPVAIKVLRPEIATLVGTDRFLREIEFAARLNHPNILPLHDSDEAAGTLYYVMPYMPDGTLRERLRRAPPPSLSEAMSLARQVAGGLAHAHALNVIHRDIKPGNILLSSGHALIADFGIARALQEAITTEERLTSAGMVLGTPSYMSPEQLAGASLVDGRADQYSLAAVIYEMLTGTPPPPAITTAAGIRRSLRSARAPVPVETATALGRALSLEPSARFPGITEFVTALEPPPQTEAGRVVRALSAVERVPRPVRYAGATLVLGSLVAWAILGGRGRGPPPELLAAADTASYAILPPEYGPGTDSVLGVDQLLHDAVARWDGVDVKDPFQVREAVARKGSGVLSSDAARGLAIGLGTGRYFRTQVSRIGDSIRVHTALYDVPSDRNLRDDAVKLPVSLAGADSVMSRLADQLLFREGMPDSSPAMVGTRSLPARQAFSRGQEAIRSWDLPAADTAFARSMNLDPQYAAPALWLALVRAWSGADPARWRYAAEQAAAGRSHLSARDQVIADAILAQGRGEYARACELWRQLTRQRSGDFVVWYGSANCQSSDDAVIRDPSSPSRWRFRSSYHSALKDYQRAFELLPSILVSFRPGSYESLRVLLKAGPRSLREGHAQEPDTGSFLAYPAWESDSLSFIPYRSEEVYQGLAKTTPSTLQTAARHQRQLFKEIAEAWAAAAPSSSDALQAIALALESLGDPSAIDTIRRARAQAPDDPGTLIRLASTEVWLLVKLGAGRDTARLREARALADSILTSFNGRVPEPGTLARLALLTGHASRGAFLLREASVREGWGPPPPLDQSAPQLLAYASMGGPIDSIRVYEHRLASAIAQGLPATARRRARLEWLARAASLAFPVVAFDSLGPLRADYLVDAQAAFASGDTSRVRQTFARLQDARRSSAPSELTIDALYPEADLLARLGDQESAIAWLLPTLDALPEVELEMYADPARVGSLVRAMALAAELADTGNDPAEAHRWAQAVVMLWSGGDDFLQPLVKRMHELAQRP